VSINLEFYAVAWSDIAGAIGSRDRRLFSKILKKTEPAFEEVFELEDFDGGPDFERGLERWIDGELGKGAAANRSLKVTNLGDALGFVALIYFYGRMVGSLNHTITAGEVFRDEFLLGAAQHALQPPYSLEFVLSRPILGYESDDYPYWGGLSRPELQAMKTALARDAPESENNPDVDGWLVELWDAMGSTLLEGKDLITSYA
jgi:hypothetical protein